jgi:hypothetical protein
MRPSTTLTLALAATIAAAAPALAHQKAPDAATILRQAKAAAGGAALDAQAGTYEEGVHGAIHYKTWLTHRQYGMRSDSEHDGVTSAVGFNGKIQWRLGPDGKVTIKDDAASISEAITTAYVSVGGYFFPDRFPATVRYLRSTRAKGRAFDVIEAEPTGGRAFELWFDHRSHLLGRIVDPKGTPAVWVELSDYRRLDGTLEAVRGVVHKFDDGAIVDHISVGPVVTRDVPASTFDPPASK